MTKLESSLQFHIKHAADIEALESSEDAPEGVSSEDWTTYKEVMGLAAKQAVSLLRSGKDRAFKALDKVIKPRGTGAQDRSVEANLDLWTKFDFIRSGRRSNAEDGIVGIYFSLPPAYIIPYIMLSDEEVLSNFKNAMPLQETQGLLSGEQFRAIASIKVTEISEREDLLDNIEKAFASAGVVLAEIRQNKALPQENLTALGQGEAGQLQKQVEQASSSSARAPNGLQRTTDPSTDGQGGEAPQVSIAPKSPEQLGDR